MIHAQIIRKYGAAAVVMLFDEKGQADTFERKNQLSLKDLIDYLWTKSDFPLKI